MIRISQAARRHFQHLIEQQDEPGLGLRMRVTHAGTPSADCELNFCSPNEAAADDQRIELDEFPFWVEANSRDWLESAEIDLASTETGSQLTIKAPGIKGQAPKQDASLEERVRWVLTTEINPSVAAHGGQVSLREITADNAVVLQFGGGCHGCGMVDVTLREGVEKTLKRVLPEISGVIDATDHSTGENPYY